ncbi:uncharacterized protein LOC134694076 [Mytilus trossulus]|uniref:uncharacterized protein LOC134694076 n=1 Tax=Mytilus trossulus TaxID=6551 RepID=UPI003006371D
MATRCNIELGNDRYVQATEWKDQLRIDIREWETKNGKRMPTKKGISLPLNRWKMLVDSFDYLDQALVENNTYTTHVGGNVYASITTNSVCVDLRKNWLPPNQTEVVPTKKGITLRPMEYTKLKEAVSVIGDFVPELNTVVPCPFSYDHQNQLEFLRCSECNPDGFTE